MALPAGGAIILKLFHSWNIVALGLASSMIMFVVFGLANSSGGNSKKFSTRRVSDKGDNLQPQN